MPTAITTEYTMPGTKRKSAPVKDVHVKESKKLKIDSGVKSALKSKSKPEPVKVVEESSESDLEDSGSEGGAPLYSESIASSEEDEDGDSEATPKIADGLHPDRAKAVVTNSKSSVSS
jgi:pumilio family protein 6